MADPHLAHRLIVCADDFGCSSAINQAVLRAHEEGILTTASLMVNEAASAEAVVLARASPRLGVGLHLTLLHGHATSPHRDIPGLVNAKGELPGNLGDAVWKYLFRRELFGQLRTEIHAQFRKFHATGLTLDHVNGHLHLHLLPTVLRILMEDAPHLGIKHLRLPADPFWLNARLASGRWASRVFRASLFHMLAARARPKLRYHGIRHTNRVFGVLQTSRVDETYLVRLLTRLPLGDTELYAHPSLDRHRHEFDALVSPRVREQIKRFGIQLIRYQDL